MTDDEAQAINNSSPAAQNVQLGSRIQAALNAEFPSGSISTDELAPLSVTEAKIANLAVTEGKIGALAVTEGKIAVGAVSNTRIASNAVSLAKMGLGLFIPVAANDARVMSREENRDGLASAIALANALKVSMNAHAADALDHTTAVDNVNFPVATADATDLVTLLALAGDLLTAYDTHEADSELGALWVYHAAQEAGDHSLVSAVAPVSLEEAVTRLNDLKAKYNAHDADNTTHGVGSAHQEATADAAYGAENIVPVAGVVATDEVVWSILDSGTGTVTGVSAAADTGAIIFTFSADPQNDAIINYAVFRPTV
jgi:hypothetical protein